MTDPDAHHEYEDFEAAEPKAKAASPIKKRLLE